MKAYLLAFAVFVLAWCPHQSNLRSWSGHQLWTNSKWARITNPNWLRIFLRITNHELSCYLSKMLE